MVGHSEHCAVGVVRHRESERCVVGHSECCVEGSEGAVW